MKFFDWFLRDSAHAAEPIADELADRIVTVSQRVANVNLSGLRRETTPHFVAITEAVPEHLLPTCVAVALSLSIYVTMTQRVGRDFFERLATRLRAWDPRAPELFKDCHGFVLEGDSGGHKLAELTGVWLIWNLKGAEPTTEEMREGAAIGCSLGMSAVQLFLLDQRHAK